MVKLKLVVYNFFQSQTGQILLGAFLCHLFILPILLITLSVTLAIISQDTFINNVRFTSSLMAEQFSGEAYDEEFVVDKLDSILLGSEVLFIEYQTPQGLIEPSIEAVDTNLVFIEDFAFSENNDDVYFISVSVNSLNNQVLRIGFDELPTAELIETMVLRLFLLVSAYAVSFLLVMLWWGKRVFHPLSILREILHKITLGDINQKIETQSSLREVRELSTDMETMRSTLVRKTLDFERLSKLDALTGLPNRSVLESRLKSAIEESQYHQEYFCIGIMDIDNFKEINDNFGHNTGDVVLQEAAARMKENIRASDIIVRLGGDEFAFIIYDSSVDKAKSYLQEIINIYKDAFYVKDHEIILGSSTGISCFPVDGETPTDLLRKADAAMYEAKKNNEDIHIYRPEIDEEQSRRVQLKSDLRKALRENQFLLHYQPKFNLKTGEIDSLEALLRWQHPVKGLMLPDTFIGIAEESNIINDFSLWVLNCIGKDIKYFKGKGIEDLKIAINISPKNLRDKSFAQELVQSMHELQINPNNIEIELTENDIVTDPVSTEDILNFCSEQGMSVAIDDFGVGYSSMIYLKDFPIDTLKIDKSFVMGLHDNNNAVIVRASIELAHNLGIKVVAEGVESPNTMKLLQQWQCDYVQGYLLSKPLSKEDLVTFITTKYSESLITGTSTTVLAS